MPGVVRPREPRQGQRCSIIACVTIYFHIGNPRQCRGVIVVEFRRGSHHHVRRRPTRYRRRSRSAARFHWKTAWLNDASVIGATIRLIDSNSRRYIALHCRATRKIYCFFLFINDLSHKSTYRGGTIDIRFTYCINVPLYITGQPLVSNDLFSLSPSLHELKRLKIKQFLSLKLTKIVYFCKFIWKKSLQYHLPPSLHQNFVIITRKKILFLLRVFYLITGGRWRFREITFAWPSQNPNREVNYYYVYTFSSHVV